MKSVKKLSLVKAWHMLLLCLAQDLAKESTRFQGLLHSITKGLETFHGYVRSTSKDYLMLSQKAIQSACCRCEGVLGVESNIKIVARKQAFS